MPWWYLSRVTLYTLFLLFLQSYWVSLFPQPVLHIDLLLPLMFGAAVEWPPLLSLTWASAWGFVMDTLSGKFWGLHVGSYVVAVSMVNLTAERLELYNPLYQMLFVAACALGQSLALGLFLTFEAPGHVEIPSIATSLIIRSMLMAFLTPLITYPVWNIRGRKP